MLSVKNIVKAFNDRLILNDVSFDVAPGQIVVLLGSSGVGKSTILRVLNNLETIDSGSIELEGQPIDYRKVGMVFQDFNLFAHVTVLQNITLPLIKVAGKSEAESNKLAHQLLEKFNLKGQAGAYPVSLSGGQKQRVALARTLALQPDLLCLDEPTSALDPALKLEIAEIIKNLAKQGLMIIITTHDIALLQKLDCTIHLMQQGKIIESASSKELYKSKNQFSLIRNFIEGAS